jgi:arylsulfatase A-like enzyme/Flp pilus assembly protein TadD
VTPAGEEPRRRLLSPAFDILVGVRVPFSVAAALFLSILAGPEVSARNLILISVDTLRADRLSCYGYEGNQTPNFDRWAREGVRFEHAYTETPLTLPAHASLMTGLFPTAHGIRENLGFKLDPDFPALAEIFRNNGYATAGFIGSYVMSSETGIARGFQVYDETFDRTIESVVAPTQLQRSADQVTDRFLEWLREHRGGPFFVFLHYFDPHMPRPRGYDWEVTQVDRNLGRIDGFLREHDLLEDTHLVVTSDHGESLGEHGESGHGFFIYDATLRVPLIFRPASTAGMERSRTVPDPVSLADVMPTVLELAGLNVPESVQGRSLVPLLEGGALESTGLYAESYVPSLQFGWSPLRSIRTERYKFIEAPRPELYDLESDPGETRNLYREEIHLGRTYRGKLEEWVSAHESARVAPTAAIPPEVMERLAALGYVGTGSRPGGRASRIDPKDRIEAFERYHYILNQLSAGESDRGLLAEVELLRGSAPEIPGIGFLLAWIHEELGQFPEARRHYEAAVRTDPDNLLARSRYAALLIRLGDYDDAEGELLRILSRAPDDYKSRNNLAGLYHMTGRQDQAAEQLRLLVGLRPNYSAAWQNLGNLLLAGEDWPGAEKAFRRVIELNPDNAAGHFQLARALQAQGLESEASRARERAFELDPRLRARQ